MKLMMKKEFAEQTIIGIELQEKTTNVNGKSNRDCGALWQKFEADGVYNKIPNKKNEGEVLAVYHNYEGNYLQPFDYFIGCEVNENTEVPEGLKKITIPHGEYHHVVARGKMPQCISDAWESIWASDIPRRYDMDFEVYSEKSANWDDAEIDIYLS